MFYATYQDYLKNPIKEEIETKPADFPDFGKEYLEVDLKKTSKDTKSIEAPWYSTDSEANIDSIKKSLDRIANSLEQLIKNK